MVTLHPAYLWVGSLQNLRHRADEFVKSALCKRKRCNACSDCKNIDAGQHYAVMTLAPENFYTIAQLEPVMHALTFALDKGEHRFFIFEQAHLFNLATANSLLKSLEEPPAGYHFILLAPRTEGILPTIRSRCLVELFNDSIQHEKSALLSFLTHCKPAQAANFISEVEKSKITQAELEELLDALTSYWQEQLKKAYVNHEKSVIEKTLMVLDMLTESRALPAMPGSTKIFLKNLFLRLSSLFTAYS